MEEQNLNPDEVVDFLGSIPILQRLPGTAVKQIAEVVKLKQFGPGEHVVRDGEAGEGLYFLWKGEADVSQPVDVDAIGFVTPSLKRGDFFGYATSGLVKGNHKADVIATSEVICLVLSHENAHLLSADSIWCTGNDYKGVADVEQILQLESLEVDLFRTFTLPGAPSFGHVFGGQLIGQALAAASKSVDPSLLVHSLHSYFLRTGDTNSSIIYKVQRIRDGHSFATRQVNAVQFGKLIFTISASFQRAEEGFEHQAPMPLAPDPEKIMTLEKLKESYTTDPRIPLSYRKKLLKEKNPLGPIDIRLCDPEDRVTRVAMEPRQRIWMRARGRLADDQALHRCVAAYASDFNLLETSMRPHRVTGSQTSLLSLDHSLWFHKSFRADEWLLFVSESPCATNARGLVLGHIYTRTGELVATVAQQGFIRKLDKSKVKPKSKL